jgi:RNA polymerase sigma-70 factor, ECF subfamily
MPMMVWMSDDHFEDVLAAAQGGAEFAFAQLWRELNPRLLRYLQTIAPSAAADLASETWLQVIKSLPRFTGEEPAFRAWVFTIARSKVADAQRRAQRRPRTTVNDLAVEAFASPDDTAVLAMERLTTDSALALIATLPRDQAEVIMLRVVAGLDVATVAAMVGKSPGAVRVSAHRALHRLQELISRPPVTL